MSGLAIAWAGLVAVYALALGSVAGGDLALGGLVAAAVLLAFRMHLFPAPAASAREALGRLLAFPAFVLAALGQVLGAAVRVALALLHLRPLGRPGIVRLPIAERTRGGVAVAGLVITLSSGELLLDVDWRRREMVLHLLDATDADAARDRHDRFYRRFQRHVFP